jgi:hypothetical protein
VPPTVGPIPPAPPRPFGHDEEVPAHEAEAEQGAYDVDVDQDVDMNLSEADAGDESEKEEDATARANPEQEREAILRMIAEGRITPEEGDMLLEALGS